jgi:hypothetical protein
MKKTAKRRELSHLRKFPSVLNRDTPRWRKCMALRLAFVGLQTLADELHMKAEFDEEILRTLSETWVKSDASREHRGTSRRMRPR